MTREYLVVYEKGPTNWSAFSPDIPGCGSMGDELEDTRANMREAIDLYLVETLKSKVPIPEATATKVDFDEFDPEHQAQYFVEWLRVALPESITSTTESQAA
jgi:predicted RNase H-like HicB family nuclease